MRDQFYGDRKDVLKWTLALQAATEEKNILYVVMYRPNKGSHGKDFRPVGGGTPDVVRFFDSEREKFRSGARRVMEVHALAPGRIDLICETYEHRDRRDYFEGVRSRLAERNVDKNFLILFDPDNGIAGASAKSTHVCPEQITAVWSAMRSGDVLLVYQHQFRDREWRSKRHSVLASAIQLPEERVKDHCAPDVKDVCFFEVSKEEDDPAIPHHSCD
jgi:hypothetical protein